MGSDIGSESDCESRNAKSASTESLFNAFSKYFLKDDLSDISIVCGSKAFPAHRLVLTGKNIKLDESNNIKILNYNKLFLNLVKFSDKSEVFAKMISIDMKESKEKVVEVKDTEPNLVRELLRFMYTGKVQNLDLIHFPLFELAHIYLVKDLERICEHFMIRHVDVKNGLEIYSLGKKYELPLLLKRVKQVFVL